MKKIIGTIPAILSNYRLAILILMLGVVYSFIGRGTSYIDSLERDFVSQLPSKQVFASRFGPTSNKQEISLKRSSQQAMVSVLTEAMKGRTIGCQKYNQTAKLSSNKLIGLDAYEGSILLLDSGCLLDDSYEIMNDEMYATVAVSKAETVKLLSKIYTNLDDTIFTEYAFYEGKIPYKDVKADSWYTPYVVYAHKQQLLGGLASGSTFNRKFKPLHLMYRDELDALLGKAGVRYTGPREGSFLTKKTLTHVLTTAFEEKLQNHHILYGNNVTLYHRMLKQLQDKTQEQQETFLLAFHEGFSKLPEQLLREKYGFNKEGLLSLVEKVLED